MKDFTTNKINDIWTHICTYDGNKCRDYGYNKNVLESITNFKDGKYNGLLLYFIFYSNSYRKNYNCRFDHCKNGRSFGQHKWDFDYKIAERLFNINMTTPSLDETIKN